MAEEILAPLAGTIVAVNIDVGQTVEEDEEVFVVEAMKMETPVFCPSNGTVKEIMVKQGDKVEEDDVLAVLGD